MKFSIVTITHNRAHLIGKTIQSVLNQSYSDFEHIIIDDGSTDETEIVVKNFNDKRIKYFQYPKNDKRSYLRNEGIRKATGTILCFLDSDDLWTSDKLETLRTIFNQNPEISFVIHNIAFLPAIEVQEKIFTKFQNDYKGFVLNEVLNDDILPFPTFSIRKEALDKIGLLDENLLDGQHDLYLRAAAQLQFYYCSRTLTTMVKHSGNISAKPNLTHYEDYFKSLEKLQKENYISRKSLQMLKGKTYSKIAYIYHRQKNFSLAKENYQNSYRSYLWNYHGLKSYLMHLKLKLFV
ncbi:glycosyltransferase [Flavobacterium sp. SM15]|uniref:glycosyltransferase family 2 protein n=1 Tax=Flavobacterium sp. SM15 TaxID=2908005 RepID=UPI001EDA19A4|nr:glycosyltransferase [Flavobacterium sp. SM15]MCG2610861.1 glycosyltransferase [Flavobacterium sp. SM15]